MKPVFPILILMVLPMLSGFTIVYDKDVADEIPSGPEGDQARNSSLLDKTFESKLLPHINAKALPLSKLREKLSEGLDAAGQNFGSRGAGAGAPWNFSVRDHGEITAAKLDTSARTLDVDTDGDGKADATLQIGPVIRGTALRDFSPFYQFDNFRDQIEFAKLARAINERIKPNLVVPEGDLIRYKATFTGVVSVKKPNDKFLVTPVSVEFKPWIK